MNKIRDIGDSVKEIDYGTKIKDNEEKYFTTADYNKFAIDILDEKIKKIVRESELNRKLVKLAKKSK